MLRWLTMVMTLLLLLLHLGLDPIDDGEDLAGMELGDFGLVPFRLFDEMVQTLLYGGVDGVQYLLVFG